MIAIASLPVVALDLNAFGNRLLRILRSHKQRLSLVGDVILFVGSSTMDQSTVDNLSSKAIHGLIYEACRASRLDRWQQAKRESAVQLSTLVDIACKPLESVELSPVNERIISEARRKLSVETIDLLMSGYSVNSIAKRLGIDESTIRKSLRRCAG